MANVYDEARFNQLYTGGYGSRLNTASMFAKRVEALAGINVSPGQSVLVVGCAFNYLGEYLVSNYQFNTSKLHGIDNSPYIHAQLALQVPGILDPDLLAVKSQIYNLDIMLSGLLNILKDNNFIGGNGKSNWVITDDCIGEFADNEIQGFLTACEDMQGGNGGIAHLVSTIQPDNTQDGSLNWKTIEEWSAYNPSHYWYDIHAPNVILGGA